MQSEYKPDHRLQHQTHETLRPSPGPVIPIDRSSAVITPSPTLPRIAPPETPGKHANARTAVDIALGTIKGAPRQDRDTRPTRACILS